MKVNRFLFALAKHFLVRAGKKGLKETPSFAGYNALLDIAPDPSDPDDYKYDIFYAKDEKRKGIALIDIHGGAYVYSTRKHNHAFMHYFLEQGFDVVILDYPLNKGKIGPDVQFGAIYREIAHFAAHKKEYGLDEKTFITGDSAGGHYALLLAETLTNPELRERLGLEPVDLDPAGVLLNCPVYDFVATTQAKEGMTDYVRRQMFGPKRNDLEFAKLYDPRSHFSSFQLPLFLSSCKQDFIGQNTKALIEDAKNLGKEIALVYLDSDAKGVDHVHNIVRMDLPESKQVNEAMIAFMLNA